MRQPTHSNTILEPNDRRLTPETEAIYLPAFPFLTFSVSSHMGQLLAQRPISAFISGPDRWRAELKNSVRAR